MSDPFPPYDHLPKLIEEGYLSTGDAVAPGEFGEVAARDGRLMSLGALECFCMHFDDAPDDWTWSRRTIATLREVDGDALIAFMHLALRELAVLEFTALGALERQAQRNRPPRADA